MRPLLRLAAFLCLVLLVGGVRIARSADPWPRQTKPGHCACREGKACWHYLRSPLRVPEDPCGCGLCQIKGDCSANPKPDGWTTECMGSQKPECDACGALAGSPDAATKATLAKQFALEFGDEKVRPKACVGWSKHFYCASDIPSLKLLTQSGPPRLIDAHERSAGEGQNRPRVKLTDVAHMLRVAHG